MRIRIKLLITYVSLILLFLVFIAFDFYTRHLLVRADTNLLSMYKLRNIWNEMLVSMDNIITDWDDGKSYEDFLTKRNIVNGEIKKIYVRAQKGEVYNETVKKHVIGLYKVWMFAQESLIKLNADLSNPLFKVEITKIQKTPGLQNLNHYWMKLFYKSDDASRRRAYVVRRVIDAIEFFPIYSTTLNRQFKILIQDTNNVYSKVEKLQYTVSIIFFTVFIIVVFMYSFIISRKISKPIIDSIYRLAHFMGSSIKKIELTRKDELLLLDEEINTLIEHYTRLSMLTRRLADGDIENPIEPLSEKEVVGNALKEVADYLHEFVRVSKWIKDGKYGSTIREKTDKDILARNFNTMSRVIDEKITTLRNVFESIEEAVLVVDSDINIVETNANFVKLLRIRDIKEIKSGKNIRKYMPDIDAIVLKCLENERISNFFSEMFNSRGKKIPIRINARRMASGNSMKDEVMIFIANESYKVRAKRERERLKAQATLSELKLLRAQINPHFLFNTLNTIAHLVEAEPESAVATVEKLSDLFRYTLVVTKSDFVSISEEINYIKQFLEIEKLRYGERLQVYYLIDNGIDTCKMPPMLLQPLVENAVKYGSDKNGNIEISISITRKNDYLLFKISDKGTNVGEVDELVKVMGTGMSNVNQRLKTLYKEELKFNKNLPQGLIVNFRIPVEEL